MKICELPPIAIGGPLKNNKYLHMKRIFFKLLSKANKKVLSSYTKQRLDLQKATTKQKIIIGWKSWVTKNALD
jgi:hypothetical protein